MSDFRLGILGYLPPPSIGHPEAFLRNMKDFPTKHPLVLFSDHDYGQGVLKIPASPEIARVETNKMACNNLVFWTAVRIAAAKRFTHILVVEPDCRVSEDHWDDIIFSEFVGKNPDAVAGGSMAIFNPCSVSGIAARKFEKFLIDSSRDRVMPLSITGSANLAEVRPSCVFPNGAFAIYRMDWLLKTFPEVTGPAAGYYKLAQEKKTWDYEIGIRLWDEFKENIYDSVVSIGCIYSGYGNVMTNEEERKELMTSGRVVGIHQIKSDWTPERKSMLTNAMLDDVKSSLMPVIGSTEIFICTFNRDFRYLKYCLRSISKFASGFSGLTILVPKADFKELKQVVAENFSSAMPVRCKQGVEWSGKGFLWHLAMICRADEHCPDAEFIAHIDPDCVFTDTVTPETFFKDGKPLLRYESFESLAKRNPGVWNWKIAVENALPFSVADEFMRGHPEVYRWDNYEMTRQLVEDKTKTNFNEFVRSCKNEYPQTFAEFPTLGAVAAQMFPDAYAMHDCAKDLNPDRSPFPVFQAWSHKAPDEVCDLFLEGRKRMIVPLDIYKILGIA